MSRYPDARMLSRPNPQQDPFTDPTQNINLGLYSYASPVRPSRSQGAKATPTTEQPYGNYNRAQPSRFNQNNAAEPFLGNGDDLDVDDGPTGDFEEKHVNGAQSNNGRRHPRRKMWIIIGALVALVLVGVAVGAGVGVTERKKNASAGVNNVAAGSGTGSSDAASSNPSSNSSTTSSLEKIPGTAGAVLSNPDDPSDFKKDSALHKAFYGLAYTPNLAQTPECGATLANITEDIQIMSQLTTRIHMYGSSCNQSALTLQAIQDTKVNMTVILATYLGPNATVNQQQLDETLAVLDVYGTDLVDGVTIGNEYILDSTDTNTAIDYLINEMALFRTMLAAKNLTVPVGTADAGSEITENLATGCDFVLSNVHGGVPIGQAATWTNSYYQDTDVLVINKAPNKPTSWIGETGWPSGSMSANTSTDGGAVAGLPQLQQFLDDYVCAANANGTKVFYFEAFDQPWQAIYGGVEPYWGLFDSDKILKPNITLPTCIAP